MYKNFSVWLSQQLQYSNNIFIGLVLYTVYYSVIHSKRSWLLYFHLFCSQSNQRLKTLICCI